MKYELAAPKFCLTKPKPAVTIDSNLGIKYMLQFVFRNQFICEARETVMCLNVLSSRYFLGAILLVLAIGEAKADFSTFTSRADWEAALAGNEIESVTFNDFTSRTSFAEVPLDIGPFTLNSNIGEPFSTDNSSLVDVAPFFSGPINDGSPIDGTPYVRIGLNNDQLDRGDTTVAAVFDQPITAWGADFTAAGTRELLDLALTTDADGPSVIVPVEINTGFFGFLLDPNIAINEIEFRSRLTLNGTERFGIDNISFVSIPEPSTLLTLGLIAVAGGRKRARYV